MANKGKTMFYDSTRQDVIGGASFVPAFFAFSRIITIAIISIIIS